MADIGLKQPISVRVVDEMELRSAFDFGFECVRWHVGNANSGNLLALRHSCVGSSLPLGRSKSVAAVSFGSVATTPIELLEQFTATPDRPRLNAVGVAAERVIVRLLGVARQSLGLVRPVLAFVDARAIGERLIGGLTLGQGGVASGTMLFEKGRRRPFSCGCWRASSRRRQVAGLVAYRLHRSRG